MSVYWDRVFTLDCRNFSERCAEPIINGMFGHNKSGDGAFDACKQERRRTRRIETKAARIVYPADGSRSLRERAMPFTASTMPFNVNFNHVKPLHFDWLYYLLFFYDRIAVFCITPQQIFENRKRIRYCERQTRDAIPHCDGQFPMTHKTLPVHLVNFHQAFISYDEAAKLCA